MQIVGRIAIILAAALLVIGIAIGLSHTSYLQNITPTRGEFVTQTATGVTSSNPVVRTRPQNSGGSGGRHREFGREGHNSADLFGIVQVVQNLIIIGLIVLPFALAPRFMPGRQSGGSGA